MSSLQTANARIIQQVCDYLEAMLAEPQVFRGQQLRGGGPVAEFESLLAEHCGFPYCVATSNAITALMALALVLRVRDRVVLFPQDYWEGSVSAFRLLGARIRRYDPKQVFVCRPAHREPPVAVIVGNCHQKVSYPPETLLIEDSCRLPGLSVPAGERSSADVQVLSFGPGKPLSLGEGGAALFRIKSLYQKFVVVSQHPERAAAESLGPGSVPRISLNGRIHPVAALLGRELLIRGEDGSPSALGENRELLLKVARSAFLS
jgi:dTDP-4-amino-4,6-dideoxygalactose transaminase